MRLPTLDDCQCPVCKMVALRHSQDEFDPGCIYEKSILCESCGTSYDVVWGVPFLGVYEQEDVLSLIEIVANADNYTRGQKPSKINDLSYAQWYELLDSYHFSADRKSFFNSRGVSAAASSWLPNRYGEHVLFRALTSGVDLKGKRVLDIGAGTGFDGFKFVRAGAQVTAIEFSPVLAHEGLCQVPQARWFGGNSNVLPFADGVFDGVVANAALHHIRDIPQTISEMLRTVMPGGWLLTLCDSYRNDCSDDEFEVNVFKDDPAVLMGVNEGIPRFKEFLSTLLQYRDHLELRVFTSSVYGAQHHSIMGKLMSELKIPKFNRINLLYPREWNLEEALATLPDTSGGLALFAQVKKEIKPIKEGRQSNETIRPAAFSRSLNSQTTAIAQLAPHIPAQFVDLPLMDEIHQKFRLLNGWKPNIPGQAYRTAYRRGRLFMTQKAGDEVLRLTILAPHIDQLEYPKVVLWGNGLEIGRSSLCRGLWTNLVFPLGSVSEGTVMAIEVRIETALALQEAQVFHVRECSFGRGHAAKAPSATDLQFYGLEALAQLGVLGKNQTRLLVSTDHGLAIEIVNLLRELGFGSDVVVAQGQESFFSCEPGVRVIGTYCDLALERFQPVNVSEPLNLIVAPDIETGEALNSLASQNHQGFRRFMILPGGHARECSAQAVTEKTVDFSVTHSPVALELKGEIKHLWRKFKKKYPRVGSAHHQ